MNRAIRRATNGHDSMNDELLFVYGTLRRGLGGDMHALLAKHARLLGRAIYQGRLYIVTHYPGVIPSDDPEDRVEGEVYAIAQPEILIPLLDHYEECGPDFAAPTEYIRQRQPVRMQNGDTCVAWVYLYNYPTHALKRIESGDYLATTGEPPES